MRKTAFIIAALMAVTSVVHAQRMAHPAVGAQVFVEPGQSPDQIDGWFALLADNGMEVSRIRMFGTHMLKEDGSWDFSLYDEAFKSAARHGIKVFATLFPPTDELTDVGGFKFPESEARLREVDEYVKAVVGHFKDAPALFAWVLQNEPGLEKMSVPETELSRRMRAQWDESHPLPERDGYLQADFRDQDFLAWYTDWYLGHISDIVMSIDSVHYRHINPHNIMETLPEYDFDKLSGMITSLGASMHMSWHFGYFERREYPLGVSIMSDIIRSSALDNPFWITEMQGGNVTASGRQPLCPTAQEIPQWMWTGIAAGSQGVIFWTLNPRAAVSEAGEWGMVDYQNQPSDRFKAAATVSAALDDNAELFAEAVPYSAPVTILYNRRSLWIQKKNSAAFKDDFNEGRQAAAVMKSVDAAYDAISSWGVTPGIQDMDYFDWNDADGRVAVLPDVVSVDEKYHEGLRNFVSNGGRLIVTGLSAYYDGNMKCSFQNGFALEDLFGATISEFKVQDSYFSLPAYRRTRLQSHLWRGELLPKGASVKKASDGVAFVSEHKYGAGMVIWLPSPVELGCWHRDDRALASFYGSLCVDAVAAAPVRFSRSRQNILMRTMTSGDKVITVIVNKTGRRVRAGLRTDFSHPRVIYSNVPGDVRVSRRSVVMKDEQCVVLVWER